MMIAIRIAIRTSIMPRVRVARCAPVVANRCPPATSRAAPASTIPNRCSPAATRSARAPGAWRTGIAPCRPTTAPSPDPRRVRGRRRRARRMGSRQGSPAPARPPRPEARRHPHPPISATLLRLLQAERRTEAPHPQTGRIIRMATAVPTAAIPVTAPLFGPSSWSPESRASLLSGAGPTCTVAGGRRGKNNSNNRNNFTVSVIGLPHHRWCGIATRGAG